MSIMTEKNVTKGTANGQMKKLYVSAFPIEEQIPWDDLMWLIDEMALDFTAYYDGEDFIGFTIVYPRKKFNWFWYFAVREELRGRGYGQQILTQLMERYKGLAIVLDMESTTQASDNHEQRKRRHAFYMRNGFRDTNVYRTYNDITMTMMIRDERQQTASSSATNAFTMQDWDEIIYDLQHYWWPDDIKEE